MSAAPPAAADLAIVQLALNTLDLPGSLRLYSEAFGFRNAGASALWGDIVRIQGQPPEARSILWWMVGDRPFFQIELFHHTQPRSRPLPADWRPSDLGWTRFGVALPAFDAMMAALERWSIVPLGGVATRDGARRLAIRDPFAGVVVEAIEDRRLSGPELAYAACSVADIESARAFWSEAMGAAIAPLERLHMAADEALWGLEGAARTGFLAYVGDRPVEVVRYGDPEGRPRDGGSAVTDQGIMNLGIGTRDTPAMRALIERLRSRGCTTTHVFDQGETIGTYLVDPGRELELLAFPPEADAAIGFVPAAPFLGAL